jgi:chromosomal replication initiator protein
MFIFQAFEGRKGFCLNVAMQTLTVLREGIKMVHESGQPTLKELWERVLQALHNRVSSAVYKSWIISASPLRIEGDALVILVPNQFAKDLLEGKYREIIEGTIGEITGKRLQVQFQVSAAQLDLPLQFSDKSSQEQEIKVKEKAGLAQLSDAQKSSISSSELREHMASISVHSHSDAFDDIPSEFSPIPLNPKYTFERFVVGRSNSLSHAAAWSVAHHPAEKYNPLFIYGGVGLGKTHLMQAIGHKVAEIYPKLRVAYVSGETFLYHVVTAIREDKTAAFRRAYRSVDVWLVDDIQFIASAERTEIEFFHIFNELYDTNRQIVICSDRPPKELNLGEARLRSRFEWGLITEISPPDLEHRIAILQRKAAEEGVHLPDDVALFIAQAIQTNIRGLEGALTRVIAYASLTGKPISIEIARESLRDYCDFRQYTIELRHVLRAVAEHFNITIDDLKSQRRNRSLVLPRHIAMYLARELTSESLSDIGRVFGKDHTLVLYAHGKIREEIRSNPAIARLASELRARAEYLARSESNNI